MTVLTAYKGRFGTLNKTQVTAIAKRIPRRQRELARAAPCFVTIMPKGEPK